MLKPYKYKITKVARPEYHAGINRVGSAEELTGILQGKPASDLEERLARGFDKLKKGYEFRARISSAAVGSQKLTKTMANLPGELEIDLLVDIEPVTPVQVDGEISHMMYSYQKLQDEEKTNLINEFGSPQGWHEVVRVPFTELRTQEDADSVARRILLGTYIAQFAK